MTIERRSFEVLESRVTQMIEQMKKLRSERVKLQSVIDEHVKMGKKQDEERRMVSRRLGKVLETLNRVSAKGSEGGHGSDKSDI